MALADLKMKIEGSHVYTYTTNSSTATFSFTCEFSDRFVNRDALLSIRYSDLSLTQNSFITSDQTENLICKSVGIKPLGKESGGDPDLAFLTAAFNNPDTSFTEASSDDIDQDYGTVANWQVNGQFAGENLTINGQDWEWQVGNIRISPEENINAVKTLPHVRLVYRGEWNSIDIDKINNVIGYVNTSTFVGAGAKKLLLEGCSFEQNTAPTGAKWSIEYRFGYKPKTWNKFWNQKTNAFDTITVANTGVPTSTNVVFSDVDFTQLDPENWA